MQKGNIILPDELVGEIIRDYPEAQELLDRFFSSGDISPLIVFLEEKGEFIFSQMIYECIPKLAI
jgi:hypothetical protein